MDLIQIDLVEEVDLVDAEVIIWEEEADMEEMEELHLVYLLAEEAVVGMEKEQMAVEVLQV